MVPQAGRPRRIRIGREASFRAARWIVRRVRSCYYTNTWIALMVAPEHDVTRQWVVVVDVELLLV